MAETFKNTWDALLFAFNYSSQQYPKTPMSRLNGWHGIGSGKGLVGVDGAAQAGMILAQVDNLPAIEREVLRARFMSKTDLCKCCGSHKPNENWVNSIKILAGSLGTQIKSPGLAVAVVGRFFGHKPLTQAELAKKFGISQSQISTHEKSANKQLSEIQDRAIDKLSEIFSARGLFGE